MGNLFLDTTVRQKNLHLKTDSSIDARLLQMKCYGLPGLLQ